MRNRIHLLFLIMAISVIVNAQDKTPNVKVEFVTPKIIRVQWSADGSLPGNNTGVCVYERQKVKSEEIVVKNEGGCISFIDRKSGKTLLRDVARESQPVVQERIVYDDATARMEETANGKDEPQTLSFDTSFLPKGKYTLFTDKAGYKGELPAANPDPWSIKKGKGKVPARITCLPRGGFVIVK